MSKDDLKKCLSCGGEAQLREYINIFFVRCSECWERCEIGSNKDELISKWNERMKGGDNVEKRA